MPAYLGNKKVKELYYGGKKVKEAWYGGKKVYGAVIAEFSYDAAYGTGDRVAVTRRGVYECIKPNKPGDQGRDPGTGWNWQAYWTQIG